MPNRTANTPSASSITAHLPSCQLLYHLYYTHDITVRAVPSKVGKAIQQDVKSMLSQQALSNKDNQDDNDRETLRNVVHRADPESLKTMDRIYINMIKSHGSVDLFEILKYCIEGVKGSIALHANSCQSSTPRQSPLSSVSVSALA